MQEDLAKKGRRSLLDEDRLFSSKFYNSVYDLSMQVYEDQARTINVKAAKKVKPLKQRVDQMKLDELVDHFIVRDSESNIELATSVEDLSGFFS